MGGAMPVCGGIDDFRKIAGFGLSSRKLSSRLFEKCPRKIPGAFCLGFF